MAKSRTKDLFGAAQAAALAAPDEAEESKGTTYALGDSAKERAIEKAVIELCLETTKQRDCETRVKQLKAQIGVFAEGLYFDQWAREGKQPAAPFRLVTHSGKQARYICQDKTASTALKPDAPAALDKLLGRGTASALTVAESSWSLDSATLGQPGGPEAGGKSVARVIMPRISDAIAGAAASGLITDEQAQSLIKCDVATRLKPGTLGRVVELCGQVRETIEGFCHAIGSTFVRFIQV